MGIEDSRVDPTAVWGTWEELILGCAVLRHGTDDWNVVVSELRVRTMYPDLFTPEICKAKYEDLQKCFSGLAALVEELRKRRMDELKRELARCDDSIWSLESKIRALQAEKQDSDNTDYDSSRTESMLPLLKSDNSESSVKETTSRDENAAGSFTKDTPMASWSDGNFLSEKEPIQMPETSNSGDCEKKDAIDLNSMPENDFMQAVTIKKRRGLRKRKNCSSTAVKELSLEESDNLGSSDVVSTTLKESSAKDSSRVDKESGLNDHDRNSCTVRRDSVMEIFNSVLESEPASVFKHRMDSQKRARYRKVIKQHVDIGLIRSRIIGESIKSVKELFRDLLLLANNALVFYSRRTREYKSALALRNLVMREYKDYCGRISCNEATSTSTFLLFNPPVKPRSVRPRPPIRKNKGLPEMLFNDDQNPSPLKKQMSENACDLDRNVLQRSLLKSDEKESKRVKPGLAEKQSKSLPVKRRRLGFRK